MVDKLGIVTDQPQNSVLLRHSWPDGVPAQRTQARPPPSPPAKTRERVLMNLGGKKRVTRSVTLTAVLTYSPEDSVSVRRALNSWVRRIRLDVVEDEPMIRWINAVPARLVSPLAPLANCLHAVSQDNRATRTSLTRPSSSQSTVKRPRKGYPMGYPEFLEDPPMIVTH